MWQNKLNEIIELQKQFGEDINSGASDEEIRNFKEAVYKEFNVFLPEEYLEALKTVNGIEFNGYILYGVDSRLLEKEHNQPINGLIDCNKAWYDNEWQKQYVFLGESGMSWYVYDIADKKYYELDIPSGDKINEFCGVDELLEKLLGASLL